MPKKSTAAYIEPNTLNKFCWLFLTDKKKKESYFFTKLFKYISYGCSA
jgi:hypothetical protein